MYKVSIITTQTSPTHPIFPVGIQSLMPHISLQLGTTSDDPNSPMIQCMVDTGSSQYWKLQLLCFYCKTVPALHCQSLPPWGLFTNHSIRCDRWWRAGDYNWSVCCLSISSTLPYLWWKHNLPYHCNQPSSQCGCNHWSTLIKATGMIIDTADNVVEAKHLVCKPFPIEFWHATEYVLIPIWSQTLFGNGESPNGNFLRFCIGITIWKGQSPYGKHSHMGIFSSIPKWAQTLFGNGLVTEPSPYRNRDVSTF